MDGTDASGAEAVGKVAGTPGDGSGEGEEGGEDAGGHDWAMITELSQKASVTFRPEKVDKCPLQES